MSLVGASRDRDQVGSFLMILPHLGPKISSPAARYKGLRLGDGAAQAPDGDPPPGEHPRRGRGAATRTPPVITHITSLHSLLSLDAPLRGLWP